MTVWLKSPQPDQPPQKTPTEAATAVLPESPTPAASETPTGFPACDAVYDVGCVQDLEALEDVFDPYDGRQMASKGLCLRMAMWFFDPNQPDVGPARAALLSKFLRNPNCEKNLVSP